MCKFFIARDYFISQKSEFYVKILNYYITTSLDRKTSEKLEFYFKIFENIYAVEKLPQSFVFYSDLTKIQKTF